MYGYMYLHIISYTGYSIVYIVTSYRLYIYIYIHHCSCICMYVNLCIYIYICICMYIYIYIYTHTYYRWPASSTGAPGRPPARN